MDLPGNLTTNLSLGTEDPRPRPARLSVLGALVLTLLGCLVAATFAWNALVLGTIAHVRTFHRAPYNLVVSMAVSDVLVATLVMPLSLAHELAGRRWRLGSRLCQLWIACDVLCCTASIWSVMAIALDRYWSITRHLAYTRGTRRRVSNLMIALTWALSAAISLAPLLFGWGEIYSERREACQVSRAPAYAVVSTLSAFYLPLGVVLFVYCRIYRAARLRLGFRRSNSVHPAPKAVQVRVRPLNLSALSWLYPQHPSAQACRKWGFLVSCGFFWGGGRAGWVLGGRPKESIRLSLLGHAPHPRADNDFTILEG